MPDYMKIEGDLNDNGIDSWFGSYPTFEGYKKAVIFGEKVTKLRDYIFSSLWGQLTLYFESAVPPTLPTNIGYTSGIVKVYVPQGKLNDYVNAYGSVFDPSIIAEGKYQY